ncbi:hypothetical protein Thimo_0030 [Thioflavicoccus mobilis 8321]|uniref:Methyltransferase family protein n=2 Tax=Thioflavicoccus mobilis TaxID=80679 RepID=L0GSX5_9GAMM|nr:hypothetical protein Thimo_0030 [Thioflavicoccus mobilis 8321]
MEVCFSADWITTLEKEIHFNWYWNQANLVYTHCSKDQKILEIGVGTSLLSDLLKRRGWHLHTLDIDEKKKPDFCASAADFDYSAQSIDVILAFEVFEHIPFSTFEKVIAKLSVSNVRFVYFSLPWCERQIVNLCFKLPKLQKVSLSYTRPRGNITTQAHFWELSRKGKSLDGKQLVTIEKLQNLFTDNGYSFDALNKIGYIQYFRATKLGRQRHFRSESSR